MAGSRSRATPARPWCRSTKACIVDPALLAPDLQGPPLPSSPPKYGCGEGLQAGSYNPGIYTCGLTVNAPLRPGFYEIQHNSTLAADVTFGTTGVGTCSSYQTGQGYVTGTDICLPNVTFVLENGGSPSTGAIMSLTNRIQVSITPYNSGSANPNDGRFAVYATTGTKANISVSAPFSLMAFQGTVYMPMGSMLASSNGSFYIDGQVIVYSYTTHGGNHFASDISYNSGVSAVQREVLRLVE